MKILDKFHFIFLILFNPLCLKAQFSNWDTDQDAMPDQWELHRQLDLNDPKDAWTDPDADGYYNLMEYLLGTDPQDAAQPAVVEYRGVEPLETTIRQIPRGSVLRLAEGTYSFNYEHQSLGAAPRLMIEGGWNSDFTVRDVCAHETIMDGNAQGNVLKFLVLEGNSAALVVDGITIRNALGSGISFTSYVGKSQLLLEDCTVVQGSAHRSSAAVYFEDGPFTLISDLIVVNSTIADNYGTGLKITQHANRSNSKVLHSLLTNNHHASNDGPSFSSGYGMNIEANADSVINVQLANSVFWDNELADLEFKATTEEGFRIESSRNIYGHVDSSLVGLFFSPQFNLSVDPLLQSDTEGRYYLPHESPALGTGNDLGIQNKKLPNIGPDFCEPALVSSLSKRKPDLRMKVFPVPTKEKLFLFFEQPLTITELHLLDSRGQVVLELAVDARAGVGHPIEIERSLPSGYYIVAGKTDAGPVVLPIIKN